MGVGRGAWHTCALKPVSHRKPTRLTWVVKIRRRHCQARWHELQVALPLSFAALSLDTILLDDVGPIETPRLLGSRVKRLKRYCLVFDADGVPPPWLQRRRRNCEGHILQELRRKKPLLCGATKLHQPKRDVPDRRIVVDVSTHATQFFTHCIEGLANASITKLVIPTIHTNDASLGLERVRDTYAHEECKGQAPCIFDAGAHVLELDHSFLVVLIATTIVAGNTTR